MSGETVKLIVFLVIFIGIGIALLQTVESASELGGYLVFGAIAYCILFNPANILQYTIVKVLLIGLLIVVALLMVLIIWAVKAASKENANIDVSIESRTRVGGDRLGTTGLTGSNKGRAKIVRGFNKKYSLCLTEDDISLMVDASFATYEWEKEINSMDKIYGSIAQWYKAPTAWVRIYMKVFAVHEISTNFSHQEQLCYESFCQIFDNEDMTRFISMESCLEYINNKYMTFFDDISLHKTLEYLSSKGKSYKLPEVLIIRNESEIDLLMKKYSLDKEKAKDAKKLFK